MDKKDVLRKFIAEKTLKSTKQREIIADIFFNITVHISLDELLSKVRRRSPKVGYATVYRTMKLLVECGLAAERHFGDGQSRYEPVSGEGHHDHLICTECGKIIEFENQVIEDIQAEIAKENNFVVTNHKLELYGKCNGCSGKQTG